MPTTNNSSPHFRLASIEDLTAIHQLEITSFASDRLSKRRLKHWIQASNGILMVAENCQHLLGYALVLLHRGTRLARLYSIAVAPTAQGKGIARRLIEHLENEAANQDRFYMRLEVANDNTAAIKLYESLGYRLFGIHRDYYEDHRDALRMQKRIRYVPENLKSHAVPWYQQTTEFTCGPSAAMMAMAAQDKQFDLTQINELDIWREATTIFMTSGHGGCHPIGLALSAYRRGFDTQVFLNTTDTPFIDSVRNQDKKDILAVVHKHFVEQANQSNIAIHYRDVSQVDIEECLNAGSIALMLISTFRMDGRKAPHWVAITAMDDSCFYVHDPDPTDGEQSAFDCQYLPIAHTDFEKMSLFGSSRLRAAVIIGKQRSTKSHGVN
ncbi:GNAT family N-acetyltransferase/peptidase C39 family protein [Aurantivibrio plasticivorans]